LSCVMAGAQDRKLKPNIVCCASIASAGEP